MRCSRLVNTFAGVIVAASLFLSVTAAAEDPNHVPPKTSASGVEEIYVVRSWRESRDTPTEFCAQSHTTFDKLTSEDHYTFRSVSIQTSNGHRLENTSKPAGRFGPMFGSPTF